jgi:hypothetical protein
MLCAVHIVGEQRNLYMHITKNRLGWRKMCGKKFKSIVVGIRRRLRFPLPPLFWPPLSKIPPATSVGVFRLTWSALAATERHPSRRFVYNCSRDVRDGHICLNPVDYCTQRVVFSSDSRGWGPGLRDNSHYTRTRTPAWVDRATDRRTNNQK